MGRTRHTREGPRRAGGLSSSSSSSDFEFTVSLSPSSRRSSSNLCPADELFYKGQLLPLHLSSRISMVRTLLLASSSSSSADTTTTTSRDSNGSSSSSSTSDILFLHPECDSSRPSSVTEEDAKRAVSAGTVKRHAPGGKYLSSFANRFSSVFLHRNGSKKDPPAAVDLEFQIPSKRANSSSSAKQVINKYVKKVKPLYHKLSSMQKNQNQNMNPQPQPPPQQQQQQKKKTFSFSIRRERDMALNNCINIVESVKKLDEEEEDRGGRLGGIYSHSHSFSGNLRYPRRKRCAGSCPSSMRSSPTHSGLLRMNPAGVSGFPMDPTTMFSSSSSSASSMEELQSAIQGAIAHCKSSMVRSNPRPLASTFTANDR